jgi:hypothetical protein
MLLQNGDIHVKNKLIMFLKEHSIKIMIGLIFIVFFLLFLVDILTRRQRINPITEKIGSKIDSLKDKASELNVDRQIVDQLKNIKLEQSLEKANEVINEYEKLEEIKDIHVRLNSKIKFYDKINK